LPEVLLEAGLLHSAFLPSQPSFLPSLCSQLWPSADAVLPLQQDFVSPAPAVLLLQQDLKKYGTNNFTRLILEKVETINQLSAAETKWLTDVDAKSNPLYYNRTNCAGVTYKKSTPQPDRGVCPVCNEKPVAINYTSNGKTRYRKLCDSCIKKGKKIKPSIPEWFRAGYRKKQKCDKCGFLSKLVDRQISVHYLDGDLKNNSRHNLVSICLNCKVEIADSNIRWKPAPLTPDF
jgi:hypothetical protein